jgi:hypothetical protein
LRTTLRKALFGIAHLAVIDRASLPIHVLYGPGLEVDQIPPFQDVVLEIPPFQDVVLE